jgi:hypothetical protein
MDNWLIFQYSLKIAQDEPTNAKTVKLCWLLSVRWSRRTGVVVVQQKTKLILKNQFLIFD